MLLGSTLAVGLIVGSTVAANADTGKLETSQSSITTAPPSTIKLTPEQEKSVKALENTGTTLLAATSSTTTGAKQFDYSKALALGAKAEQVAHYASVWQSVGQKVVNLPVGVSVVALDKTSASTFQAAALALQNCTGQNQAWQDFWGDHVEIDSCVAQQMIGIMSMGAGAEGLLAIIAAALTVPVAGWIVGGIGAVFAIGAGAITYCAANGTGITLHFTGVPWCGAQS